MNLNHSLIFILLLIIILINVLSISSQSTLSELIQEKESSSTSPKTTQDYNSYIKNWGFELGWEFWDGDVGDLLSYNELSYHLYTSLSFGFNENNNNTIQSISQNVYIPKLNDSSSEQYKFEFSILLPTIATSPKYLNYDYYEEEEESLTSSSSSSSSLSSISFLNLTIQLDNIILFQFNLSEYWKDNPPNGEDEITNYLTISIDLDNSIFGNSSVYHKLQLTANIDSPSEISNNESYKIKLDNIQIYKLPNQLINSNLYVSMQGSDIFGNGTELSPFRTIQKAIDSIDTTINSNDIIISSTNYLFQSDETIFNRGKNIKLKSLDGSIIIETTQDYTGFFFVSTSPIYYNNSTTTTNTTEIILNCQNYFKNNIENGMIDIQFTIMDLEIPSFSIENTNSTFSATQFSNIQIENLMLSTINQGISVFVGNTGSIFKIIYSNISSMYEFGTSNLMEMESNEFIMDSNEFTSYSTVIATSNSNITITNSNFNGFVSFNEILEPYQQIYYENISMTNISGIDNYIFSFTSYYGIPYSTDLGQRVIMNNIIINNCEIIEFLHCNIYGYLIIDGLSLTDIDNIRIFLIIGNDFNISNVFLYSNNVNPIIGTSVVPSISNIVDGVGHFNNIIIDEMNGIIESPLFGILNEVIFFNNVTYTNSNINFISSNATNIYISNFKCESILSGSIFSNGESSFLEIDNLLFTNNQVGMIIDMSFNVAIINSTFSNNKMFGTQLYSVPLVSSSFTLYLENTLFLNNQGLSLISTLDCGVTLINVTFDKNNGMGILSSGGSFYGDGLQIINGSSMSTLYPSFVTLLSISNLTLVNSEFSSVTFPLSISMCIPVSMDNVNFYNSTGTSNIILLYGISGKWTNSIIYGTASSLLASPFNIDYSDMIFQSVEFSFISSSNYPFGIYIGGVLGFIDCTFKNSVDVVSGGMNLFYGSASFIGCKFQDNTYNNAIIVAGFSEISLESCTFSSNTALNTSSIAVNNSTFSIVDTIFSGNSLSSTINITFSQGTFDGCTFKDNSSPNSIIVSRDSEYSLNNSIIVNSNSKAYSKFSIIIDDGSYLEIANSAIQNSLTFNIPTCFLNNSYLVVFNSTFKNNTNIGGSGGVFFLTNCYASFENVNFQSNYAHIGGSIYSQYSNLSILGSSFQYNIATAGGSIFYYSSNSNVSFTNFIGNSAQVGFYSNFQNSTINSNGGSVYISDVYLNFNDLVASSSKSTTTLNNMNNIVPLKDQEIKSSNISIEKSAFSSNTATFSGGGLFNNDGNANISIGLTSFYSNVAQHSGGGEMYSHNNVYRYNLTDNGGNRAVYGNSFASNLTALDIVVQLEIQVLIPFVVYIVGSDIYGNYITLENSQYNTQLQTDITLPNGTLISTITQSGYYGDSYPVFSIENNDTNVVVGSIFSFYVFIYSSDINLPLVSAFYNETVVGCIKNSQFIENGICSNCPPGTIGYDGVHCFNCNANLYCPGGSIGLWETGYYFNDTFGDFNTYSCNPVLCLQHTCRDWHYGPLCGICHDGFTKSMSFCQPWFSYDDLYIFYIFVPISLVIILIFLMVFEMPNRSILYPLFSNIQIISMLAQFSESYSFYQIFNARIDFITALCLIPGLSFYDKFYCGICTIVFLILSTCILKCTRLVKFFEKFKIKSTSSSSSTKRKSPNFFNILVSTSLLFFIPTILFSFQILSCTKVGDTYYLLYDTQLQCYDHDHLIATLISSICILYYLMILIYLSVHLIRNQSLNWLKSYFSISKYFKKKSYVSFTINDNDKEFENKFDTSYNNYIQKDKTITTTTKTTTTTTNQQSIYFNQFKFNTQYWQVLQMLCYLPMIFSSTFITAYSPFGQLLSLTFITFQFFILVIQPPFKTMARNVIEIIFVFILFIAAVFNNSRLISTTQISGYLFLTCSTSIILLSIAYTFKKFKNYLKNK